MPDIPNQEIILKKSRKKQIINAVVAGAIGLGCIFKSLASWNRDGQWGIFVLGLVALVGFLYYLKELRESKVEIVITLEGIRLSGEGFYTWSSIEKFSTHVNDGTTTLILYVREQDAIRFEISDLELEKKELIELILTFGQTAGLTYSKYY
jgi:hypothetical protein